MVEYNFTSCYTKKEAKQRKFWQTKILGARISVSAGVIGKSSKTTEKNFRSAEEAFRWLTGEVAKRLHAGFQKSGILNLATATSKATRSFSLPMKKSGLTIDDALHALRELQGHMDRTKNPDYRTLITFPPPSASEIRSEEQRIGWKLPPSYTELITKFGAFEIRSEDGHCYWRLFSISEITPVSTDLAGNFEGDPYGDQEEYEKRLKQLIGFQWAPYEGDDLYVFDSARADRRGEMPVDLVTHEEAFQPSTGFRTLARHLYELSQEIGKKVV